jgi:U3 small nucleolar RNA-associated protein 18
LNIDARGSCGTVGSLTWQALGTHSLEAEPVVAFSTRKDKEVRICRVSENGKKSTIEFSVKINRAVSPKVIKFVSANELLITNNLRSSSKLMIYNIEAEKSNFYSTMGGKEITQTRFVVNNYDNSLFSISYSGSNIVTLDRRSKQFVSEQRLNNPCVGLNWSKNGYDLFVGDDRANIYQFDSRTNRCVFRTQLESISSMSSFAMNSDQLIACGSPYGTVDIVDVSGSPQVLSSFDKLVTSIDNLTFHPIHKSLLVASSKEKRNALRLFECGNGRTLPNWPSEREPIGRSVDMEFSSCGRFLAIGCKSGRVQMYAL